jgi:hypothetical protein
LFQRRTRPDGWKFYLGGKFFNLPPRMAGCAGKSFATPQSCLISIKVVAVGQRTRTNVDCINTEFAGCLALVGFAGEKIS